MLIRKFDGDFPRERFLDMDDWEATNVLARPNAKGDKSYDYWPVSRMADPLDPSVSAANPKSIFYHPERIKAMKTLGMTDAEIDERYAEWSKQFHLGG